MEKRDMPKELGLFYVVFLTAPLYIQWDQFTTVQVTLPITYNQVPLNFMLVFKFLRLNLLNIVIFGNLDVIIGGHPTRLRKIWTIFKLRLSKSTLK